MLIRAVATLAISCLALSASAQDQPAPAAKPQPRAQYPEIIQKEIHGTDARGKKAPAFICDEVIGGKKPDRKGKVLLIDFWATWCAPCRAFIPELNEFQDKFKDDLVIIGMSDEPPNVVKDFLKTTETRYTQAVDNKGRMKRALKISGIPHVIIISTDNIIRWQGFPGSSEERLTADIIQQVIDADPGVQARHAKEADAAAKKDKASKRKSKKDKDAEVGEENPDAAAPESPAPTDPQPNDPDPSAPAPSPDPRLITAL